MSEGRAASRRGRGRGRGRGGSGGGGGSSRRGDFGGGSSKSRAAMPPSSDAAASTASDASNAMLSEPASAAEADAPAPGEHKDEERDICFICAEPVKLYSVPPCSHRVCHICAMRLRALWKKRECTFCKTEATRVIFTANPTKGFGEYTPDELPYVDEKLSIYFESRQDYEDTIALLRFNCPNLRCDAMCSGWADLRTHVKRAHSRLLCELCMSHKKIFAHEHQLFTAASLQAHNSSEHRYCEYCHKHYYSDDELWVHMRDSHEQCHICKSRSEEERWRYYKDYRMLVRTVLEQR